MKDLIQKSLETANQRTKQTGLPRILHRNRSRNFVEALADSLRQQYHQNKSVYVLSKHYHANRSNFGLNELLFDILVCETDTVLSAAQKKNLTFVTRAIWEIESELSHNTRESVFDFNKLILGASENKLFIGTQVSDEPKLLDTLLSPAKFCNSNTYIALVPHPANWGKQPLSARIWKFQNNSWTQL